MRRLVPCLAVAALTVAVTATCITQVLARYQALHSGWSWDLAYYNQWFWALTQGDGTFTVRPASPYSDEGPSVWHITYLAPIRFALAPIYAIWPDPRTLLAVHSVIFWWLIPASYTLVRAETGSRKVALAATVLVPATPLLWPLAWNDFRELQLALPFVVWAIQGWRSRNRVVAAIGIAGMLACRQEFAFVVATLAIVPPREREDIGRTYLWSQTAICVGLCWFLFAFLGYLKWTGGNSAPLRYVEQFGGPRASIGETLQTAFEFLAVGLGSWAVLACLAPRVAILAVPWLWGLARGRWALRFLGTEQWHHVRYCAPFVVLGLAAGLIGFARLATWLKDRRGGRWLLAAAWATAASGLLAASLVLQERFAEYEAPISTAEAAEIWGWVARVGPDDTVLASYEVSAPLSSRRRLFSYVLQMNRPKGFPTLDPEFRWVFIRNGDMDPKIWTEQGFERVFEGSFLSIYHRGPHNGESKSENQHERREPF
jgi:Predicted membrane protein (DUF2079)